MVLLEATVIPTGLGTKIIPSYANVYEADLIDNDNYWMEAAVCVSE